MIKVQEKKNGFFRKIKKIKNEKIFKVNHIITF